MSRTNPNPVTFLSVGCLGLVLYLAFLLALIAGAALIVKSVFHL